MAADIKKIATCIQDACGLPFDRNAPELRDSATLRPFWQRYCPKHRDTGTPPTVVTEVKECQLTNLQKTVLEELRKRECHFIAAATEEHWKRGEGYYIDTRVSISKQLRAEFNRANDQAGKKESKANA